MPHTKHAETASHTPWSFRYEATPADRDVVRAIVESTGFFNPAEVAVAVELVDERLAKGPSSGYHFVFAERDGRTHGYASYGHIAGTAASYDLYWIAVEASSRRGGLGRILLAESERLIHEAGGRRVYVETSTRDQYHPTRAFYERSEYRLEVVLEDFYGPGDGKAIYVKVL
jgi:GNAT superfamily N-acetyltransferase